MTAYSPDPDRRDPPPLDVICGFVVWVMVATLAIGGPAMIIGALWLAFGPQPLPAA